MVGVAEWLSNFYELDPKGWGSEKMLAFEGQFSPKPAVRRARRAAQPARHNTVPSRLSATSHPK